MISHGIVLSCASIDEDFYLLVWVVVTFGVCVRECVQAGPALWI